MSILADLKQQHGTIVKIPLQTESGQSYYYFRLPKLGEWIEFEKNRTNSLMVCGLVNKLLVYQESTDDIDTILTKSDVIAFNIMNHIIPISGFNDANKLFELYETSRDLIYTVFHQLMQFIISVMPIYKISDIKQMSAEELMEVATFAETMARKPFYVEWIVKNKEYAKNFMVANDIKNEEDFIYDYDTHVEVRRMELGIQPLQQNNSKSFIDSETGRVIKADPDEYRRMKQQKLRELKQRRINSPNIDPRLLETDVESLADMEPQKRSVEEELTMAAATQAKTSLARRLEIEKSMMLQGNGKRKHFNWNEEEVQ